jgi:hypothetical protein
MAYDIRNKLNLLAKAADEVVQQEEARAAAEARKTKSDLDAAKEFGADVVSFVNALKNIPPTDTGSRFYTNVQEQSSRLMLSIGLRNENDRFKQTDRGPEISVIVNRDTISCSYKKSEKHSTDAPHLTARTPEQAIEFISEQLLSMAPRLCQNADRALRPPERRGPQGRYTGGHQP